MSLKKIFSANNKLKSYIIKIGTIELIKENIVSFESVYKNNSPKITAKLTIDDIIDYNILINSKIDIVNIIFIDLFDNVFDKDFIITSVDEKYDEDFKKILSFELQDTFSYKFEMNFLSKSYNSTPIEAIKEYISFFELDYEIDAEDNIEPYNFVVPNSTNNLDFFIYELEKHGYIFNQDRTKINIQNSNTLQYTEISEQFMNETGNQLYMNKIHELKNTGTNKKKIKPRTKSLAYDFLNKSIKVFENNENTLILNNDNSNIQETTSIQYRLQTNLIEDQHLKYMKDGFLQASDIEIIVNGYFNNDINKIFNLKLKGTSSNIDSQANGNKISSGKYISNKIVDKLIGDTLIQKISLYRADAQK